MSVIFIAMTIITLTIPGLGGQGYAFAIGAIGILMLTFFHFYQLLNGDEVLNVKYKLSFWISTALLLFYLGSIPLILLSKYMDIRALSCNIILLSLNIILNGCYIIGFIWTKKKYNRF
jgi:signal transduction histidine kinase